MRTSRKLTPHWPAARYCAILILVMNKLADIMDAARKLTRDERQRLIAELGAMESTELSAGPQTPKRLSALRALSGAFHSDYADLSTNKYEHVGAAIDGDK
jgi:hypothetical protein